MRTFSSTACQKLQPVKQSIVYALTSSAELDNSLTHLGRVFWGTVVVGVVHSGVRSEVDLEQVCFVFVAVASLW